MDTRFLVESFESHDGTSLRFGKIVSEATDVDHHPIVFVPGLAGSVKFAIPFLERFVPHHGPVYSLDGRGFGLNEGVAPKPNPGSYIPDLDAFVNHLLQEGMMKRHKAPLIFGLSLGGVLTTLYLTRHNHPFQGAVLLSPAFCPHPNLFTWEFRMQNYLQIACRGFKAMTTLPYGVNEITRNPQVRNDPHFTEPLTLPSFYMFLIDQLCRKAYSHTRRINVPTALVVPECDAICDPQAMRTAYERIAHPKKAIFIYPELFHDVAQEPDPDQHLILNDISRWVSTLGLYDPAFSRKADASGVNSQVPYTSRQ